MIIEIGEGQEYPATDIHAIEAEVHPNLYHTAAWFGWKYGANAAHYNRIAEKMNVPHITNTLGIREYAIQDMLDAEVRYTRAYTTNHNRYNHHLCTCPVYDPLDYDGPGDYTDAANTCKLHGTETQ